MSYQVRFTSKAQRQLAEVALWWAEHRSVEQATRWLDGFESAIQSLSENPERHVLAGESEAFDEPVRQLLFGLGSKPTHRALFEIRGDTVFVVAIRHLAQRDVTRADL